MDVAFLLRILPPLLQGLVARSRDFR